MERIIPEEEIISSIVALLATVESSISKVRTLRESAQVARKGILWPYLGAAAVDMERARLMLLEGLQTERVLSGDTHTETKR